MTSRRELLAVVNRTARTRPGCRARYTARYIEGPEPRVIYRHARISNLALALPSGTSPDLHVDASTFFRSDGGDPFERAYFTTPERLRILIEREP